MFPNRQQIVDYYRKVLETNDRQLICCNPFFPVEDMPIDIAYHSLSTLQPLLKYPVKSGDCILDIGCGAGADCFLAAYRGGPQTKIYGIDIVEELISRANELKAKYEMENIEFLNAVIPPIPFESDHFDLVMMNYSFHLFEDKAKLLGEIFRVLHKGGKAIIADSFTPKEFRDSNEIKNWLMSAGGAIGVDNFKRLASSVQTIAIEFIREELPHIPEGETIGYMICEKIE